MGLYVARVEAMTYVPGAWPLSQTAPQSAAVTPALEGQPQNFVGGGLATISE